MSQSPSERVAALPATPSGTSRKLWLIVPMLAVFGLVFVGGHAYLADRLVAAPALPAAWTTALTASIWFCAATLILQPIAERLLPASIERYVVWPAAIWMGVAFMLLIALLFSDLLFLLLGAASDIEPVQAARVRAVAVVALVAPAALLALRQGLARPAVKRIEVQLPGWPATLDGLRIAQISDIHFGPILGRDFAEWLRDQVTALAPDLIAITGDLVDGPVAKHGDAIAPFAELRAPLGRYFVTGNHDHYSGARSWVDRVAALGITVLRNEHVVIETRGTSFVLAGVDDHRSRQMPGEGGEDLEAALEGIAPERPIVLLAHDPTTFKKASRRGVELQLSGHTHGGQIWPFKYFVRLAMPFVAGLYRRGDATLYVSRGTGFWGPPMRLGAPAEITEITLRSGGR